MIFIKCFLSVLLVGPFEPSVFWLRPIYIMFHHWLAFSLQVTKSEPGSSWSLTFRGPCTSERWGSNIWSRAVENEPSQAISWVVTSGALCSILSGIWFQFVPVSVPSNWTYMLWIKKVVVLEHAGTSQLTTPSHAWCLHSVGRELRHFQILLPRICPHIA